MSGVIMLPNAAALDIQGKKALYHGGDQEWFPEHWQRQAGCGPTNCSNLVWYLAQTRKEGRALCSYNASQRREFLRLMEDVWRYVTPGSMGVNSTSIFVDGAVRYGADQGVPLMARALDIPPIHSGKRSYADAAAFVAQALECNLPVAFLNLSNGSLRNLDSWHWVTLVALRGSNGLIYDQGKARWIDLEQWLATSVMGGGFVTVDIAPHEKTPPRWPEARHGHGHSAVFWPAPPGFAAV